MGRGVFETSKVPFKSRITGETPVPPFYPCHSAPLAGRSSFGSMRALAFIISSQVTTRFSYAAVRPRMQVRVLSALCWALLMYFLDTTLWQKLLILATAPVL